MRIGKVMSGGDLVAKKLNSAISAALRGGRPMERLEPRRSYSSAPIERLEERRLFATIGLDPTFGGGDGVAATDAEPKGAGSVTLADGSIVIGGVQYASEDAFQIVLTKLRPDGSLDTTFGGGDGVGEITVPYDMDGVGVRAFDTIAPAPGGKFVLGTRLGDLQGGPVFDLFLARFNGDGSIDSSFSGDGLVTGFAGNDIHDVLVQPDGKTLVLGEAIYTEMSVTRLNVDGSLDLGFGGNGTGTISRSVDLFTDGTTLGLTPDGRIYVGGDVSGDNRVNYALFRYTSAGLIDTSFGGGDGYVLGENGGARDMVVEPSGNVVIIGSYGAYYSDIGLQRFTANGTASTFQFYSSYNNEPHAGPPYDSYPNSITQYGGKFYVALGQDTPASGADESALLRFNADLTPDTSFNSPPAPGQPTNGFIYDRNVFSQERPRIVDVGPTGRVTVTDAVRGVYAFSYGGDDTIAQALPLAIGTTNFGEVFDNTDVAMRKVTVTAGKRIGFDVDLPDGSSLNSYLRLFDAQGRELAKNDDAPALGEPIGADAYLDYTFATAGTYYVGVSGAGNDAYSAVTGAGAVQASFGRFELTATPLAPEANGRIAGAVPLPINTTRYATVSDPTDVDVYAVTVVAGQRVMFDVDSNGSSLNGYLRLFDAGGAQLASNDNRAAPGEQVALMPYIDHTFTTAGTYYVAVSGSGNSSYNPTTGTGRTPGSVGAYSLEVTVPVRATTPLGLNDSVFRSIDAGTEIDYYAITVSAGQRVGFDMDSGFSPLNGYLRVFSSDWRELAHNDNGAAPGEGPTLMPYLEYAFATAGTYYVSVSGYPNTGYDPLTGLGTVSGSTGTYRLSTMTPPLPPVESNDRISTADRASLNATKTNQDIADGTDVDLYRVTVQQGQRVGFDVDTNGSPLDSYMRLFDSSGRQLAANDDGIAPGEQIHRSPYIAYTFPAAGTYYVAVSGKDNRAYNPITGGGDTNGSSTGAYTLDVRVLPGPTPTDTNDRLSTATGAPLNTTKTNQDIADGTDVDLFRITVAAGQRIGFDVDNNGSGLDSYMRLFDASGRQLAANENGVAPGEQIHLSPYIAYTFATAGTYYVAVSSTGNTGYDPLSGLGDVLGRSTGAYTLDIRVL
ncbi:MAG TPA: DVUA0089 family protein [Tepidisphaeraceae bacterium]|jgi:uncharacterized delta-60 repeat protein|nr:DVUA0089 family protein [Tepidisphaeraceae bacterium]